MLKYHLISISFCLFLFACKAGEMDPMLLQQNWQLTNIDGQAITSETHSHLSVDAQGSANGQLACNLFFGKIIFKGQQLRIKQMGTTRKLCAPKENDIEFQVRQTLTNWSDISLTKQMLILKGDKHTLTYQLK